MCTDRFSVVSSVDLVLNQRLMRRRCQACTGEGCPACLQTGYRGRVPVLEWAKLDDPLRREIRARGPEAVQPKQTLERAARELVGQGLSDQVEFERIIGS
jgi:type II secretory ATPase GspE/PulE/Tfp pilus assembly ATPase PilB-like protein